VSEERRLHPLSWFFAAAQAAKGFLIPILFFLFASGGQAYELWAAVFIIPVTLSAVVRYVVFRYRFEKDELVVRDGILTRTERHIPYARIQNIDLVQNPLHRLLNVALVRVETASGQKPEAVIRVLSLDAVAEMRAHVFEGREDVAPSEASLPSDVVLRLPARELAKLGVVSNKGLVVVGAAVGALWQRNLWWNGEDTAVETYVDSYLGTAPQWLEGFASRPALFVVLSLLAVGILAVVLLRLFSVAWFLVQLYGFTLRQQKEDLRAEYGLFNKISRTIPTPRIQTLITTESPLHRWFGRQSVELRTVGGGGDDLDIGLEGAAPKAKSQWLAPMVPTERVPQLVTQVLPEVEIGGLAWEPLAPRAWQRLFRRGLIVVALLTIPATFLFGVWAAAFALLASAAAYVHSRLTIKHTGYSLTPWGVVFKTGWWDRTMKIVRYAKIQTVSQGENPFDRRNGMASVRVDTAGAEKGGHTIDIPYLERDTATNIARRLYAESSGRVFQW
jgi:putative membrane protein